MFRHPCVILRESHIQSTMQSIAYVQFVIPLYAFAGYVIDTQNAKYQIWSLTLRDKQGLEAVREQGC